MQCGFLNQGLNLGSMFYYVASHFPQVTHWKVQGTAKTTFDPLMSLKGIPLYELSQSHAATPSGGGQVNSSQRILFYSRPCSAPNITILWSSIVHQNILGSSSVFTKHRLVVNVERFLLSLEEIWKFLSLRESYFYLENTFLKAKGRSWGPSSGY